MADLDGKLELCLDNSANCNTSTNTKLMLVLKTRFCWTQDGRRQRCSSKGVYCLIRNTKNVLKTQGVRVWLWAPEAGRKGTVKTDRRERQQTTLEKSGCKARLALPSEMELSGKGVALLWRG